MSAGLEAHISAHALRAAAAARGPALLDLLADLVEVGSGSLYPEGSREVMAKIAPELQTLGFSTRTLAVEDPESGLAFLHMRFERPASAGPSLRLLHLGHTDTVFGPEHPFRELRRGDARWRGPGVADMKGGLVTLLGVQQILRDLGALDRLDSRVLLNSDEEIQSRTSRALVEEAAAGRDLALVYEPGRPDGSAVFGRKGVARYRLVAHGRAAHAGNDPRSGRSAILAAARAVVALEALSDPGRGRTVNVGLIRGGTTRNTVPDRCEVEVDGRFEEPGDGPWLDAEIRRVAADACFEGVRIEASGGVGRPAWSPPSGGAPEVEAFTRAAADLGLDVPLGVVGGGSDGNFTAAMGVPTLDGLGMVGGGFHTPGEWVDPGSLVDRVALAAGAILALLDGPREGRGPTRRGRP